MRVYCSDSHLFLQVLDSETKDMRLFRSGEDLVIDDPSYTEDRWAGAAPPPRKVPKIVIPIPKSLPKSPPMPMPFSENNKENNDSQLSSHKSTTIKLKISPKSVTGVKLNHSSSATPRYVSLTIRRQSNTTWIPKYYQF